jgi:hypothetical protein
MLSGGVMGETKQNRPSSDQAKAGGLASVLNWWRRQGKGIKIVIVLVALAIVGSIIGAAQGGGDGDNKIAGVATTTTRSTVTVQSVATTETPTTKTPTTETPTTETPTTETPTTETPTTETPTTETPTTETPALTMGQQQAVGKAQDYLDYTAFSRQGLIEQLIYEGFTKADGEYAVDYVAPDWNEQAALKAQDYLDYTAFSRQGLIDQLIFDGFTKAQAEYGVAAVGY